MSVGLLNKVSRKTRNNFRSSFHSIFINVQPVYNVFFQNYNYKIIILSKRGEKYCPCKKYNAHKNFNELICQKEKSILYQAEL